MRTHGLNIKLPPSDEKEVEVSKQQENGKRWSYPLGRFDWKKPLALQLGEWDEWREDMKQKFPIRYFFYEQLPDVWDDIWKYGIVRFFKNIKWWSLHRFHPRYRYHVVKTNLKPGYYDPDTLIFETTFKLLTDYVEDNEKWDAIDWEGDEGHSAAWNEMKELVHWYKDIYPNRESVLDAERPEPAVGMRKLLTDKYDNDPDVIAYRKYLDYRIKKEDEWEREDEEMLIRAIKLRPYLWYA